MSSTLQQIVIGDTPLWVEVSPLAPSAGDAAPLSSEVAPVVKQLSDADLTTLVRTVVEPAHAALKTLTDVQECSVSLSIGLKAEVGFFLAKGEANAALRVSVTWKKS